MSCRGCRKELPSVLTISLPEKMVIGKTKKMVMEKTKKMVIGKTKKMAADGGRMAEKWRQDGGKVS
ncbi:hypothetical protein ES708_07211 [subsurface metagenome]